jgi:GNAT superfamily N-acetyltransferase
MHIDILVAQPRHAAYAQTICDLIEESAKARGTGIAKRKPEYIEEKIRTGKAVIALAGETVAGFSYIETWEHGKYVANSGLIVNPDYRRHGLARRIKAAVFGLSREKYPEARIFGITTSLPVMKINSDLGYRPVTFSELTQDDAFWAGCKTCPNYDILERNDRRMCLCTAMLAPSAEESRKISVDLSDMIVEG